MFSSSAISSACLAVFYFLTFSRKCRDIVFPVAVSWRTRCLNLQLFLTPELVPRREQSVTTHINVRMSSCRVCYFCLFVTKLGKLTNFSKKPPIRNLMKICYFGSSLVPCEHTDGHGEAGSRYLLCEHAIRCIEKDMEGNFHGVIWETIPQLAWRD